MIRGLLCFLNDKVACDRVETSAPTSSPTEASTPSATSTSAPTSSPTEDSTPSATSTSAPTSSPTEDSTPSATSTSAPTSSPTSAVSEHIYVHVADMHGDGWTNDLLLKVEHHPTDVSNAVRRRLSEIPAPETFEPEFYSLNCACKVIRLPSVSGDMTISMFRNTTEPGPRGKHVPYEWEALWTLGYSDGVSANSLGVYGDVNTEVVIENWNVVSSSRALDVNADAPKNRCIPPPPPKPRHESVSEETINPPMAKVRLVLAESEGTAWCDDSGATHEPVCSKENVNIPDATFPNLLTYPRYFISDADGSVLFEQGTMRVGAMEDVREVKLPREGSFVFSVSGHYLSEGGSLSWDFCGEQGGIGERLHFDMVHGVCKPHYIEELNGELSCNGEWTTGNLLSNPINHLSTSSQLSGVRFGLQLGTLVAGAVALVALVLVFLVKGRTSTTKEAQVAKNVQFARLDTTEHA